MCGIAGIYQAGAPTAFAAGLSQMLAVLAHRGPDGEGLWIDPQGKCGLGHKRLAIIDPEGGQQPLANPTETLWITFEEFAAIFDSHGAAAMVNRMLCFDLKTHLQALLQVEDRTSMAWGLESRVPLLDYRLVELIASVPPVLKFKHGQLKSLFRRAVKHLVPTEILDRKDKMGFPVPLNQWFKHELRAFVMDTLLATSCRERGIFNTRAIEKAIAVEQPFSRGVWGALCLELWYQQFID